MKNFKNLFVVFLVVCLAGMLECCKSASIPPPTTKEITNESTTKIVIRDTVFLTEKDSSYYKAWLECKDGKVVIKKETEKAKPGNHLKPPKANIQDNVLTVTCEAEAQRLFAEWKDTYTKENHATIERIPYEVKLPLTTWEIIQIWCGRVLLGLLAAVIIGALIGFKKFI